ncbi:anti-anti-sigma factor [Saccharothrix saharensis]|uniref:Anti-sigma factor antagonist n=1 Tax=Saccharothrix saharensis TaxID=571190 RepID=A0A543JKC7_9PSEU|nr:STAS domain-containing protein [Saccharothrix saharensis]TQM83234.1 anti-anti-sigma factor [Saccharothrix saharensis]
MGEDSAAAASAQAVTVDGVPVLRVVGELDMTALDTVRAELLIWLDSAPEQVVIDLTGVTFMGSSGLALLIEAAAHADRCGVRFVLAAGHREVLRPIQVTNLDEVFDLYPDVAQAVAAVTTTTPQPSPVEVEPQDV